MSQGWIVEELRRDRELREHYFLDACWEQKRGYKKLARTMFEQLHEAIRLNKATASLTGHS